MKIKSFISLGDSIDIFEFLSKVMDPKEVKDLITNHVPRAEIVFSRDSSKSISSVMIFSQINDPYDIDIHDGPISPDPFGKYIYISTVYIDRNNRNTSFNNFKDSIIWNLFKQAAKTCPGAIRIAFKRRDVSRDLRRFHIIELKDNKNVQRNKHITSLCYN